MFASKLSAQNEQCLQPSSHSGSNMKWYTISWLRPAKRSASVSLPFGPVEDVLLVDGLPREVAALSAQLVAQTRELLLLGQQRLTCVRPLVVRDDGVLCHVPSFYFNCAMRIWFPDGSRKPASIP